MCYRPLTISVMSDSGREGDVLCNTLGQLGQSLPLNLCCLLEHPCRGLLECSLMMVLSFLTLIIVLKKQKQER
ncbi:hypothetical protein RJT34_12438 [Clitoria ternatea]|uniref:Uncharacterized protein n=1 Tax=Clitoria ternatea TaxID=43366 RepID=A0AAN9JNS2_CLITE